MLKRLRTARVSVVLLIVALALIGLHALGVLGPVEGGLVRIISPLQYRVFSLGTAFNGWYQGLSVNSDLRTENSELATQVTELTIENAQLRTLISEHQALTLQLAFLERTGLRAVTAYAIGKNPEPNLQSIILNKGSADGLSIGAPLVVGDGIMVGKISMVALHSAEAILVNDSRSKVAVLIQNATESQGVVVGEHGLSMKVELIPQNELVKEHDAVVTSGLESGIARGLVVGTVSRVTTEPNGFFQTAQVSSLANLDALTVVSVLVNQQL